MTIAHLSGAALLLAAGSALAGVDPIFGGNITTDQPRPSDFPVFASHAFMEDYFLAHPQAPRYLETIYSVTKPADKRHASVTWVDNPKGSATDEDGKPLKVFRIDGRKPSLIGTDTITRGELSPNHDYTVKGVRWYAISFYVPPVWNDNTSEMIVGQLHTSQKDPYPNPDKPGSSMKGVVVSPPVSVAIVDKYIKLSLTASEFSDNPYDAEHIDKNTSSSQSLRLAKVERDTWYCLVMRADWSPEPGKGEFDLWLNGKQMYSARNAFNSYQTWLGNYAKSGLYVPGTGGMDATKTYTVYTSYIYLGDSAAGYATMAERTPCAAPVK